MNNAANQLAITPVVATRIPKWALAVALFSLFAVYVLLQENGTLVSAGAAQWLHEATHDARHALGVPCH